MDADLISNLVPPTFFETLEYIEGKALLRIDIEKGVKIAVCDIKPKNGFTLNDIPFPDEWKILDIMKEHDNIYTCLLKTEYTGGLRFQQLYGKTAYKSIRNLLGLDIIFDLPFLLTEEKVVISFVVNNEIIRVFLKMISLLGGIKNVSFQPASFSDSNILSCLTERQKEIITVAQKSGYYDVPRKVSTEELSEKLGISTATILEHLRKAEHRIISTILAGY
jgi:predicted DNA binding protein